MLMWSMAIASIHGDMMIISWRICWSDLLLHIIMFFYPNSWGLWIGFSYERRCVGLFSTSMRVWLLFAINSAYIIGHVFFATIKENFFMMSLMLIQDIEESHMRCGHKWCWCFTCWYHIDVLVYFHFCYVGDLDDVRWWLYVTAASKWTMFFHN